MVADANEVEKIISGELIVGNHESIIVLGSEAQGQLRSFSKAISEILGTVPSNFVLSPIKT